MRVAWPVALLILSVSGCHSAGDQEADLYQLPAEWEPHEAVWVSFFGGVMDSAAYEMATAVGQHTPVKAVVSGGSRAGYEVEAQLEAMGVAQENIEIINTFDDPVQVRDSGPIFTRTETGKLRIVDFAWNGYGTQEAAMSAGEEAYPFASLMASKLDLSIIKSNVVMEGGAMETNGKGTLLVVEAVTLQRNPGMSKAAIETELKRVLGQKKIIWLKEGVAEDPHRMAWIDETHLGQGTGGHVDAFARFVDARTILLAFPDSADIADNPVKQITYERMQVNYDLLKQATDQDGQPFEIIKVPVPDIAYMTYTADTSWTNPLFRRMLEENPDIRHGDLIHFVPASSYVNYFVTNDVVLVPAYWQPGMPETVKERDERFQKIISGVFAGREIVPIDPFALNMNGGGIHCWTQQQPAGS